MTTDALRPFRETIDAAGSAERAPSARTARDAVECAAFARTARNAVARAILAAALSSDTSVAAAEREPPEEEIRALLGAEVGAELAELYRGGDGWTSRAIDLLAPLNELAHAKP